MEEQSKQEMMQNIVDLEAACNEHDDDIEALEEKIFDIIRKDHEHNDREERLHRDTVEYLNDVNQDYKDQLEVLLANSSRWLYTLIVILQLILQRYRLRTNRIATNITLTEENR